MLQCRQRTQPQGEVTRSQRAPEDPDGQVIGARANPWAGGHHRPGSRGQAERHASGRPGRGAAAQQRRGGNRYPGRFPSRVPVQARPDRDRHRMILARLPSLAFAAGPAGQSAFTKCAHLPGPSLRRPANRPWRPHQVTPPARSRRQHVPQLLASRPEGAPECGANYRSTITNRVTEHELVWGRGLIVFIPPMATTRPGSNDRAAGPVRVTMLTLPCTAQH